jgi:hypothetical protein
MKDEDLYHGFAPEKQAEYEAELIDRLGEDGRKGIEASKAHWGRLGKEAMQAALEEGGAAEMALVERFRSGDAIDAPGVVPVLDRHRAWVSRMWGRDCPPQAYGGMADLYASHPDFRARYEAHGEGFTDWLTAAMKAYAARAAA